MLEGFSILSNESRNLDLNINILKAILNLRSSPPLYPLCSIDFNWIREYNAFECRNQSRRISFHRADNSTRIFRIFTRQLRITVRGSINPQNVAYKIAWKFLSSNHTRSNYQYIVTLLIINRETIPSDIFSADFFLF